MRNLKAGDVITAEDIRSVRPGFGAAPKLLNVILGKRVLTTISANDPVLLENLE